MTTPSTSKEQPNGNGHQSIANRVFGVPLEVVMSRSNQKAIPTIVKEMILSLQRNGNTTYTPCIKFHK
jgi:hypothetical protein